ncbi:hypothetical protein MJO28_006865 [Puccinia striiformis f. sp. tritici]|uniref:Uncharacterized protein n=2 Tax=Puccinia striiformis f. sp. tritici TaxID=168172 RepID=A0A0L0UZD6_9BASI|nr:hypothetical protein MJO28_006865 [Puccinia striiformis f. sp. tritici]KAI9622038.1 hypothetical protein H4Q26_015476 [Puccinia striiformis f. sp. tritici PST-130]KNE92385.1 hypothetical protein PSTG_14220 [Puccinia striiformis f. sp. tritici PST-78]
MAWIKSLRFAFPIVCYSHLVLSLDSPLGDALAGSSHPVHLGYSAGLAENLDHAAPCKTTNLHPGSLDESFRDDFQARYSYETTPYEGILFYEEAVIKRYLSSLSHTSGKRTGTTATDQAHDSSVVSASAPSNMEKHANEVKGVGKIRRTRPGGDNTLSNRRRLRHEKKPRFRSEDHGRAEGIPRHVYGDEGNNEMARSRLTSSTPPHGNFVGDVPSEYTKRSREIIEEIVDTIMGPKNLSYRVGARNMKQIMISDSIQVTWDNTGIDGRRMTLAFSRLYTVLGKRQLQRDRFVPKIRHLFDALEYCHKEAESGSKIQLFEWFKLILVGKNQDTIPLIGEFEVSYLLRNPVDGWFSQAQILLANHLVNTRMKRDTCVDIADSLIKFWRKDSISKSGDWNVDDAKKQIL